MAKTENDLKVTKAWQNLVATYPGMANMASYIQNKSFNTDKRIVVVFSPDAVAPAGANGLSLAAGELTQGTAANIWVRAIREDVLINCGTAD
ncbi:MAG: hypothetical protein ACO1OX_07825 [Novosphingobium sp.]